MSSLIQIGTVGELADGGMKQLTVQGRDILLARVGESYYATDNRCAHMGGNLAQGRLEGTVVTCPRHGSQFDLRDGSVVRWLRGGVAAAAAKVLKPPRPIASYPVKIDAGKIMAEI